MFHLSHVYTALSKRRFCKGRDGEILIADTTTTKTLYAILNDAGYFKKLLSGLMIKIKDIFNVVTRLAGSSANNGL